MTDQGYIDSHCHIDMVYEKGVTSDEVENAVVENHLKAVIQIGSDPDAMVFSRDYCSKENPFESYYTIGSHPNEVEEVDTNFGLQFIDKSCNDPKFVAVGEIGLDYFYGKESKEKQLQVFEQYLEKAAQHKKAVCVHTRDAHFDTLNRIKSYNQTTPVLIHCFTGDKQKMNDFLSLGAYISFSGIVTFKNAKDIQYAALDCPLDRMLVETDAPFLTPVPNRGKVNRPGWVQHVCEFLAELRSDPGLPLQVYKNTRKFYNLP